jgi:transcriptional regulator with GAF, ATPase, and Fis domain
MAAPSSLMQIQPFIQAYVLAVSSILEAAVTVVDSDLIRVGGTGNYAGQIGQKINHTAFFAGVLASGKPGFIKDVKKEGRCFDCPNQDTCEELGDMAYPVFLGSQVVGVVGIIAFKESEQRRLLRDQDKLHEFLKYMCLLIESKLLTQKHSHELEQQMGQVISLEKKQLEETPFLGHSRAIRDTLALVEKISASDSTVLLSGESGTGKEVMARSIHNLSPRGSRLMTSVNCGAIPESLVESELFGYEEGAFTGAKKGGQLGKFELANGSTLFLDEIGEMPLPVQTKLLRVLQERCVQRLGGKRRSPSTRASSAPPIRT